MTVLVNTGFKMTCDPAGSAECNVAGEMTIECVEDVVELFEMVIRRLRMRISEAKGVVN
jgi:hypothetical protein